MKKLLSVLLLLCLTLTACGDKGGGAYDAEGATEALLYSGAFSLALEEVPAEALYDFSGYGLDTDKLTEAKAYAASGFAEQVSVTVWKSADDAKAAVAAFGDYLQDMKDMNADYAPEEVGKLDRAIMEQRGSSVLLVVAADEAAAKAAVEALS